MSILANLHHLTRYRYDRLVALAPQIIRLRPVPHCRTRIESYSLNVTPVQHFLNWQQDPNGNWLARLVFPEKTREFTITVDLIADMTVINPFDFFLEPFAETFPFAYPADFAEELAPYLDAEPAEPRLAAFLASIPRGRKDTIDVLVGSISVCIGRSAISRAWSRACKRPSKRWRRALARAATARGCKCKFCDIWVSQPASCPVT